MGPAVEAGPFRGLSGNETAVDLFRCGLAGNTGHLSAGRSFGKPGPELIDGGGLAAGDNLHPAVGLVSRVAGDAQALSLVPSRSPVKDALDPP